MNTQDNATIANPSRSRSFSTPDGRISTKKDRSKMTLQESEQMPVSRPYSRVMEGGRNKMQYQQAEPLGLKEEGGEPPQH